ncbi:MAG: DbpA RNA binding domain-containing protein [Treponema sp.]|nr:DbpA RNA binding domain-containing protein [Treponema sp.]
MSSYINKEKAKRTVALVIDSIKTEADASLLDEYLKIFKKEVALFNRSRVAAYLLMLCDQGKTPRFPARNDLPERSDPAGAGKKNPRGARAEKRAANAGANGEADTQRYPLADEESVRLFFSAGRSRRVSPREILGLINSKTAIPREDIGAIRILDNYSFVQVRDTSAEKIIGALNGLNFRGRPLTVNYAKSRRDEANGDSEFPETGEPGDIETPDEAVPEEGSRDSEQDQDHPEKQDI